jgi:hypothetical protein
MPARVPLAIVVGLAVGVIGDTANLVASIDRTELEISARLILATNACLFVAYALLAIGLFDLARRGRGRARALLTAAAIGMVLVVCWYIGRPLSEIAIGDDPETLDVIYRWGYFGTGLIAFAVVLVLVIAARKQRPFVAATLALLAVLARPWTPYVGDVLSHLWGHPTLHAVYWTVNGLMWTGGVLWLSACIAKHGLPETADPPAAASGLRLVATALHFRIVAALVIAFVSVGMIRSAATAKVVAIGGPLVILATTAVAVLGCMRSARSALDGLPARRLAIGGALVLWWCALQLDQLMWLARAFARDTSLYRVDLELAQAWSIAGPLIATAGFALVGSAISAFAARRADDALRESASVRTLLFVVLSASSVAIQSPVSKAESRDGFLLLMFVGAGAGIGALVSLAGLARQAAGAIDTGPTLPPARVHTP